MSLTYHQSEQAAVAPFVAKRLRDLLQSGKKVLWLLSGGSGGAVCVQASKLLSGEDLSNLYITLTDERYGPVDHADENMRILLADGFSAPGASMYRVLQGEPIEQTTDALSAWLTKVSSEVDYTFAVLGIGEDGHTCGIKPGSIAVDSSEVAAYFQGDDFERITITPTYVRTVDEAVVQAFGANKHAVIAQLLEGGGDVRMAPMLTIRAIPQAAVFSDYQR